MSSLCIRKPCTHLLLTVDGQRRQDRLPLSDQDAQLPAVSGVRSQGRQQPQVQRPAQPAGASIVNHVGAGKLLVTKTNRVTDGDIDMSQGCVNVGNILVDCRPDLESFPTCARAAATATWRRAPPRPGRQAGGA